MHVMWSHSREYSDRRVRSITARRVISTPISRSTASQ